MQRYQTKVSGPILDRIDLRIDVGVPSAERVGCKVADFLRRAMTRWNLSVRAFDRALAVARTIADLEGTCNIDVQHVAEALQYRVQSVADA